MNSSAAKQTASPQRLLLLALMAGAISIAGWRISHGLFADASLADGDTDLALEWQADHPGALLRQGETMLASNDLGSAEDSARHLLQVDPTDGRGFRILAQVAVARGNADQALTLFGIAARRAPRDLASRAWLAQHALERGDIPAAMGHIDSVLTLSPASSATVFPVLLKLAKDPAFAAALADVLQRNPPWRAGMLGTLRVAGADDQDAARKVMAALQNKGGMDPAENAELIESLLRANRWGEAHARWASPIVGKGHHLPILYNADFSLEPTGSGFDWRMPAAPGVLMDLEQGQGVARIVHVRFLGRRVASVFLEHALFLAPGKYSFRFRQRSDTMRSENGISWTLSCAAAPGQPLAESDSLNGSRPWAQAELTFVVPAVGCQGQWLRLGNAKGMNIGQVLGGDAWISSPALRRSDKPAVASGLGESIKMNGGN